MDTNTSISIIGAGIVGSAIALELASKGYTNITVIERNDDILGKNQSTTNEGTIHSGIYHPKDIMPLKAKLSVEGNTLLYEFMDKHMLSYSKVGKLIIATTPFENEYLDFFLSVGIENGVLGVKKITSDQAREMEPNLSRDVIAALYVPSAGVTSPLALIEKVKTLAVEKGVTFLFNTNVEAISAEENGFTLSLIQNKEKTTFHTKKLINSAGLYADEIARMINPKLSYEIEPARGEFFHFDKTIRSDVSINMHIYQPPYCYSTKNGEMQIEKIPASKLKEKLQEGNITITAGVHLSPTYDYVNKKAELGTTVTISPLKTIGYGKEDYETSLHPAQDYIKKINYFFPNVKQNDIAFDHTGIMCPLKGHRDFVIEKDFLYPDAIQLIGMESPSWTACFAIAKHVAKLVE